MINNEEELEERLSRPTEHDIAALAALDGDLMILGAGGKMGPSLAKLARRAIDANPHRPDPHRANPLRANRAATVRESVLRNASSPSPVSPTPTPPPTFTHPVSKPSPATSWNPAR